MKRERGRERESERASEKAKYSVSEAQKEK